MKEISAGWNENNARRAASCFTEDAIYSSVPSPKIRKGHNELYKWFVHHLVFDPDQQIGVGEYTFKYEVQTHGLVIVRFKNGRVSNWREYEEESPKS